MVDVPDDHQITLSSLGISFGIATAERNQSGITKLNPFMKNKSSPS